MGGIYLNMKIIMRLEDAMRTGTRIISMLGLSCLVVLTLATIADVLMRWLVNSPLDGVHDLYKLVIAVVVGSFFPVALIERHHISITFLGDAFGDRVNKLLTNFANIMLLGFLILMCWQFTNYVLEVADTGETTWILQWSVAPWWAVATVCIYLCLPVQLLVTIRDMILPSSANQHGNCEPREPKA